MAKVKSVDERDTVAGKLGERAVLKPLVRAMAGGIPAAAEESPVAVLGFPGWV